MTLVSSARNVLRASSSVIVLAVLAVLAVLTGLAFGGAHAAGLASSGGHALTPPAALPVVDPPGTAGRSLAVSTAGTWTQLTPTASPSPRSGMAMATDLARNTVVLFGGQQSSSTLYNDTWIWNGTTWTLQTPPTSPSRRYGHRMAYDPTSRSVLLFGGVGAGSQLLSDTWLWDGRTWTQQFPTTHPSARTAVGLATQREEPGGVVLLGGNDAGVGNTGNNCFTNAYCASPETWFWTAHTWHLVATMARTSSDRSMPSPRNASALAMNPSGQPVLVGGELRGGATEGLGSDTWVWVGPSPNESPWQELRPAELPLPRSAAGFAGTQVPSGGLLLFSGREHDFRCQNDTWFLDMSGETASWTKATPATSPPPALGPAMATDPTTQTPLLFIGEVCSNTGSGGKTNQTWRWGP